MSGPPSDQAVELQRVTYRYPKSSRPALDGVDFAIPAFGVFGLLGPNGAGKTTLLRLIAALMAPTRGRILVLGQDTVQNPAHVRRSIGYVPQEYDLYPHLTGREFLHYMALLAGIPQPEQRVMELLDWAGLQRAARHRLRTYSGGMKQRLAVAQALLTEPPILILDEPTTGLDPEERRRFKEWIFDYSRDHTVVFSSHLIEDIALLSHQVAVLRQGAVRFHGPVRDLLQVVAGRVWQVRLTRTQYAHRPSGMLPVSTRLVDGQPDQMELRFVWLAEGKPPLENAHPVAPALEDAYVFLQHGGEGFAP